MSSQGRVGGCGRPWHCVLPECLGGVVGSAWRGPLPEKLGHAAPRSEVFILWRLALEPRNGSRRDYVCFGECTAHRPPPTAH